MLRDKVIDIFVPVDDFCIEFDTYIQSFRLGDGQPRRNRKATLSDSEIIAILILFHNTQGTGQSMVSCSILCLHSQHIHSS